MLIFQHVFRVPCSYFSRSVTCRHFILLKEKPSKKTPNTLPQTNIAPKNGWLEYYFPIGEAYFQGQCHVSFREGKCLHPSMHSGLDLSVSDSSTFQDSSDAVQALRKARVPWGRSPRTFPWKVGETCLFWGG